LAEINDDLLEADFSVQISPFRAKPLLFLALHSRSGMAALKNARPFLLAELSRAGRKFPEWHAFMK
jgi:hypothetical protein